MCVSSLTNPLSDIRHAESSPPAPRACHAEVRRRRIPFQLAPDLPGERRLPNDERGVRPGEAFGLRLSFLALFLRPHPSLPNPLNSAIMWLFRVASWTLAKQRTFIWLVAIGLGVFIVLFPFGFMLLLRYT